MKGGWSTITLNFSNGIKFVTTNRRAINIMILLHSNNLGIVVRSYGREGYFLKIEKNAIMWYTLDVNHEKALDAQGKDRV